MVINRTVRQFLLLSLAVILIFAAGCGNKDQQGTGIDKPLPVTVSKAKKENISTKTIITGKVTPLSEVVLIPKIAGKVAQVTVDVGSAVKKGSTLVKLDTTDLQISLNSAATGLQSARLTHNQAVLNYNNARDNYDRMVSLYNEGAISKQQLEQAELSYNLARDSMNAPAVASAQNQVANIKNQISNGTITSPIDGEIAMRSIDPGEMASPTQPVMTVVNIDKVYIEGTVAESDVAMVSEGQKVTVKVDAAGGTFEGSVKILSPVANAQTKGYPIKIEINNSGHKLKPGMFAEIQMVTKSKNDAVVILKEALVIRGSDKVLYIVKNGVVEERKVTTGIEGDDKVEISAGLTVGEEFVIEGQQSLFDKAKVTVRTQNQ
jgi:RND family efflux transporter MFP subunit